MKNNATVHLLQGTLSETVQFLWLREEEKFGDESMNLFSRKIRWVR